MERSVDKPESSQPAKDSKGAFLKGVAAVAAVVSLLLALNQFTGVVQNLRVHHKEFSDAMSSGEQQMQRADYAAAFKSFKRAMELDPIDKRAQQKQTEAAMSWLENVHANDKQSFTDVANQLLPVLDTSLTKAKGQLAGDIMAHIAWSNFLKYRDGQREGVNVDGNLKAALDADPNNVYAHAMSGHWALWNSDDISTAQTHFKAALATGRVHDYVRELQLSALENHDSPENDIELLRVSDEMRKGGETTSASHRHDIFWKVFTANMHSPDFPNILKVLAPADTVAIYDWLDDTAAGARTSARAFMMADLKEVTGDGAGALADYQTLKKQMNNDDGLLSLVNLHIQQLSRSH
jgi:tetratricopeptide (TPR) repeat protein